MWNPMGQSCRSTKHIQRCFHNCISALEQLAVDEGNGEPTKSDSDLHVHAIERFDFTIALCTAETCMQALLPLSKQLQEKNCDLVQTAEEVVVMKELLQGWRNDPETTTWEEIFRAAEEMAEHVGSHASVPLQAMCQRNRNNVPADTRQYWKRALFYPLLDHVCLEIDDRLLQSAPRYSAQFLVPSNCKICLQIWRPCCLRIFILPQSHRNLTATAERSFSAMLGLKPYLRSTMLTNRLTGLALMNVYRNTFTVSWSEHSRRYVCQKETSSMGYNGRLN